MTLKMKKILYIFLFAAIAVTACKKGNEASNQGKGKLSLKLMSGGDYIIATKADNSNVNDFTVKLSRADGWSKSFDSYSAIPQMLELGSGEYTITASSPLVKEAAFDLPVYGATENFTIRAGELTPISLNCTLQNMKVTFELSENFKKELSNYNVTITNAASWTAPDASERTLVWNKSDLEANKPGYFSVAPLQVKVDAYRAIDNSETHAHLNITKVAAKDHHIIKLDAKVTGSSSVTLQIDNSLNNKNSEIFIPGWEEVPANEGDEPEDPGSGGEQPSTSPSLVWEANPTFAETPIAQEMDVNLVVNAPEKIKTFVVSVDSNVLSDVIAQLAGKNDYSYEANGPFDMDLINDTALIEALNGMSLNLPTGDQLAGKTKVDFSLSSLIPMIDVYNPQPGSKHKFTLKVSDLKDQTYEKALVFFKQ